MSNSKPPKEFAGPAEAVHRESARRTRRSFLAGGAATAAGWAALEAVNRSPAVGRLQSVLRRTEDANAALARTVLREHALAPEYPLSRAVPLRLNGAVGLEKELAPASWRLQLAGLANPGRHPRYTPDVTAWTYHYTGEVPATPESNDVKSAPASTGKQPAGQPPAAQQSKATDNTAKPPQDIAARFDAMRRAMSKKRRMGDAEAGPSASSLDIGTPGLLLTLDDLLQLPRAELVTEFKCVEGWSQICQWAGVRLRDLLDAYPPAPVHGRDPRYLYMETPEGDYYCGYDLHAARHPQSLLVTEMAGRPLTQQHGAPLRLHMPIKYGYKQIKRIGLIAYTDQKPDDFWTKLGYDWYAGL